MTTTPTVSVPVEPIPDGVYFSAEPDNFYDAKGKGMGMVFYRQWRGRTAEFPRSREALTARHEAPAIEVGALLQHHDGRAGAFVCNEEDGRYRVKSLKGRGFWIFHPSDCVEAPAEGAGERHWIERYADGGGVVLTGYDVNAEDQAEWDEVHLRFIALDGAETYRSYSARSAPEASPQVEAVAWRVKDYGDGWIICHDKDSATNEAALMGGATVQPLYTHPQPAQTPGVGGGGVREAAQALLTACVKDFGDPDDFTGDDGAVASGTDGDCAVTFKHLRDLAAALAALAAGESA